MRKLLVLTLALIAYGSLYPWRFHSVPAGHNPFLYLVWPAYLYRPIYEDMGLNVVLYVPIGLFAFFSVRRFGVLAGTLCGFLTSLSIEIAQQWVDLRSSSLADLLANSIGGLIGALMGWLMAHRYLAPWARRCLDRADALVLVLGWIAWQVFPLTPNRTIILRLYDRPVDFLLVFAETAALSRVVKVLDLRLWYLLPIVPLKAFIWGRGLSAQELVAVSLVLVLPRIPWVPGLLVLAILIEGLLPFRWMPVASPFSFVPFWASLTSDWFTGIPVLLGKASRYAALVWLLHEARWPWWSVALSTTLFLGAIEVLQRHLPGRTPEITDPLLALIAVYAIGSLRWVKRDVTAAT